MVLDGGDIEGGRLVDKVVEPVAVEQIGAGAPRDPGRLGIVVIGVVVSGNLNRLAQIFVPQVLLLQGAGVVL